MDDSYKTGRCEPTHRLLIVGEVKKPRRVIGNYFMSHNLSTITVDNGAQMRSQLELAEPSLILLGLDLGQENGLDLLREVRSRSFVPVIIVTDEAVSEGDRVVALNLGADDYVMKPYGLPELLARVNAVLRRSGLARSYPTSIYRFDGWRLLTSDRSLVDPDGSVVSLAPGEYAMLLAFLRTPRQALTLEQLQQAMRADKKVSMGSMAILMFRLRRKLKTKANDTGMILYRRGSGYIFTPSVETL